eukprot:TRINITY_DN12700_c0_g1_i1.p1 TRINITY_DN12700_c0_g1~~TRINITY_DN12700_c0_g1_i1.p1  ORF type:complete len:147 (-),score=29.01 TRINITY_DN12700_c0_g1_i1:227-667(-)
MSIGLPSIRMNKDGAERSSSNLIRKQTEYIRSGDQIKATKTQRGLAGTQNSAMRKMEAQRLAECFEWRLATHCEEEFDMFEVLEYEVSLIPSMGQICGEVLELNVFFGGRSVHADVGEDTDIPGYVVIQLSSHVDLSRLFQQAVEL